MHELFRNERIGLFDGTEIFVCAEVAVSFPEGVVHLGDECAKLIIAYRDPKAHGIEVEPKERGLGQ